MNKYNKLSRAEMRNVKGGIMAEGRCVMCTCPSGETTCWYSKRAANVLCNDVCDTNVGVNSLDDVSCTGCTMN